MSSKHFAVVVSYEIWEQHRDDYLAAMEKVKLNALNIGAVAYYLMEDDDVPNKFTEVMLFDSWMHYRRAQKKKVSYQMEDIFDQITGWTIGGIREVNVKYKNILLGDWWKSALEPKDEANAVGDSCSENADDAQSDNNPADNDA